MIVSVGLRMVGEMEMLRCDYAVPGVERSSVSLHVGTKIVSKLL